MCMCVYIKLIIKVQTCMCHGHDIASIKPLAHHFHYFSVVAKERHRCGSFDATSL